MNPCYIAIRIFQPRIGVDFHNPRAVIKLHRCAHRARTGHFQINQSVLRIAHRAFEQGRRAHHINGFSVFVLYLIRKGAIRIVFFNLPFERRLLFSDLGFLVKFLPCDIGLLNDQSTPAMMRIIGHAQIDHDNHAEECQHDRQHMPAGERARSFSFSRHYLFSGAMKIALYRALSDPSTSWISISKSVRSVPMEAGGIVMNIRSVFKRSGSTGTSKVFSETEFSSCTVNVAPGRPSIASRNTRGVGTILRSLTVYPLRIEPSESNTY